MTVISISEECHGFIGLAKDFESAKDFLFKHGWIDEHFELCNDGKWYYIDEVLGNNWEAKVMNMTIEEFNKTFDSSFYLEVTNVYGT